MILSQENKFLLIKNRKVGGTSLEVELSKILPDSAIVTTINPPNKEHRPRNMGNFLNHSSYSDVDRMFDLKDFGVYTIIRNPYEMVFSDFFFQKEVRENIRKSNDNWGSDMNNLLNMYFDGKLRSGSILKSTRSLYTLNDNVMISKFIRHENGLESEINKILPDHGLPKIKILTNEKAYRPKNIHYSDMFTSKHIDAVCNEWSWEFDNLGYNR